MNPFNPYRKDDPVGFWTIAGAVCLGVLAAHAVELIVAAATARLTIQWAAIELEKNTRQGEAEARERARQIAARAEQQRQEAIASQAAAAKADQERRLAEAQKEAAWKQFYKRDPACDNNPNTETFTRCANEHVRAKTQFEGTYRP